MSRYGAPLLLLCAAVHVAFAINDGLLPNGNFEAGPKPSELRGTEVVGRHAIPEWEVSGFVEYIESGHKQGDMLLVVPEGAHARGADVRAGGAAERLGHPDSGVLPMQTMYSSTGWDSYAWGFRALFDELDLVIHNPGLEEDPACGPLIDSVAIRTLYPPRLTTVKNLLKNGDMEEGPYIFPNTTWGVLIPPNIEDEHSPLPGWKVESLKAVKYVDAAHYAVPRGLRAAQLVGGGRARWRRWRAPSPGAATR
uniref:DUF642 domain-containing protein n=1 Tax=Ananas comosus var. bracteatus TaxID=296719 RepID=A0A6V7NZW4_ANACO|nr:unnamed protein product [Ananas comosus var. bracteatus]